MHTHNASLKGEIILRLIYTVTVLIYITKNSSQNPSIKYSPPPPPHPPIFSVQIANSADPDQTATGYLGTSVRTYGQRLLFQN